MTLGTPQSDVALALHDSCSLLIAGHQRRPGIFNHAARDVGIQAVAPERATSSLTSPEAPTAAAGAPTFGNGAEIVVARHLGLRLSLRLQLLLLGSTLPASP